jgi:hypothetical protein
VHEQGVVGALSHHTHLQGGKHEQEHSTLDSLDLCDTR